jgi:hypothetical protein
MGCLNRARNSVVSPAEQQFCLADEPIRTAERMPGLWASGFSPGPVSPAGRAISQTVSAGRGRFAPAGGRLRAEGDALQFIDDAVGVAFGSQTACYLRGSSDSGFSITRATALLRPRWAARV